jgi:hypothetical protein
MHSHDPDGCERAQDVERSVLPVLAALQQADALAPQHHQQAAVGKHIPQSSDLFA